MVFLITFAILTYWFHFDVKTGRTLDDKPGQYTVKV